MLEYIIALIVILLICWQVINALLLKPFGFDLKPGQYLFDHFFPMLIEIVQFISKSIFYIIKYLIFYPIAAFIRMIQRAIYYWRYMRNSP